MTDTTAAIYDVLAAYTGLSDARNRAIAMRVADAISAHIEAREAAAAEAMREAARNTAASFGDGPFAPRRAALAIAALPLPDADALARALERARAEGMEAAAAILEREAAHWREWSAGELARNAAAAIRARGKETSGE